MFEKNRNQESRRVGLGHGREGIRRLKDHQCWGPRSASGPAPHAGNWKGGQNRGTSRLSRKKKKKRKELPGDATQQSGISEWGQKLQKGQGRRDCFVWVQDEIWPFPTSGRPGPSPQSQLPASITYLDGCQVLEVAVRVWDQAWGIVPLGG